MCRCSCALAAVQHRVLLPAVVVRADHDAAGGYLSAVGGGHGVGTGRVRRRDRRRHLRRGRRAICWAMASAMERCFVLVGTFHLIGFLAILLLGGRIQPLQRHRPHGDRERRMKITEVRTRVVQWEGETVPLPPHFCTNPMDLVTFRRGVDGQLRVSWLGAGGDLHGQRAGGPGQCGAVAAGDEDADRYVSEAAADRGRSVGHRVSVAADVSADDGVWAQGRGDGGDLRGGYRAVGSAGQGCEAAGVSAAGRAHEGADSGVCEPAVCMPSR